MLTVDLQYEYLLNQWNSRIDVGMFNALNEKVPAVASEFMADDPRVHDPRGRMVYVNLSAHF